MIHKIADEVLLYMAHRMCTLLTLPETNLLKKEKEMKNVIWQKQNIIVLFRFYGKTKQNDINWWQLADNVHGPRLILLTGNFYKKYNS